MRNMIRLSLLIVLFFPVALYSQTVGKIAGTVVDAENNEPLPGVNVIVQGTTMGAATNTNGYFVIVNVPPGIYTLKATFIGYAAYTVNNVAVKIDLTTNVDFKMSTEALAAEEVVIVAERPVVVKDVSSSQSNISAAQIENLPSVRSVNDVVGLQAGIVIGESGPIIRGSGADEIAFMVDGFTQRDERTNLPFTSVSLSAVQEILVQTGGFNAEHGNIRSGVISVVTKEGSRERYSGTIDYRHSPAAKKHFGPSAYDPNGYWLRPFLDDAVAWTGTANGAWSLNTQRQYPSFVGWNTVSQQSLEDNDPSNDLTPEAAQRVFKYQHRRQGDIQDPDYVLDLGLGGPMPLVSKKLGDLRFYFSFRSEENMYLIPLSRESFTDNTTMLKLASNIKPNMKVTFTGQYTVSRGTNDNNVGAPGIFYSAGSVARILSQRSYIDMIMYAPEAFAPSSVYRHLFGAKLTHTLGSNTFYEVSVERTGSLYSTFPNDLRDSTKVIKIGNSLWLDEQPYGFMPFPSTGINGLRMGVGMSNSRDSSKVYTTTFGFDITSQVNSNNQIKAGIEYVYNDHHIRYGGVDITLPSGRPSSSWDRNPIRFSAYLQDKLEFKGLIANIGVRFDLSDPGGDWYDVGVFDRAFFGRTYNDNIDEQTARIKTEKKSYFSPRLGISHPITENSKLYFNYGHFRSMPVAERLYTIQRLTDKTTSRFADPNLDLSKTVAYELGYDQSLFGHYLLHLAAYYKDVSNQPNWVQYTSADNKVSYQRASDDFYEDIRGVEFSLEKRIGGWLSGFLNYTYEVTTSGYFGRQQIYENPADQRTYDRQNIPQFKPLARPYFRANLTVNTPADFGPMVSKSHPFADWRISLLPSWRTGYYTTWTRGASIPGVQYNVQWPDYFNIDLKISRDIKVAGMNWRVYLDVNNVLNTKIFNFDPVRGIGTAFSDGQDFRDYMDSLLWPEDIGKPIGYTQYGNDKIGDLRPDDVAYDPLEPNPNNDPEIEARNQVRRDTKSYIDNPNLKWLYYLNPRDIYFGIKIDF